MHVGKGWPDEGGMKLWIDKIWHRRPGGLLKKIFMFQNSHDGIHNLNTDVAIVPGGLTCQLQPLDVSIKQTFQRSVTSLVILDD